MVMRPKSMATVVVVLAETLLVSSIPAEAVVMAASVVSGLTSEMAPTKVVLPTPKPPATTNLTAVTCETRSEVVDTPDPPLRSVHVGHLSSIGDLGRGEHTHTGDHRIAVGHVSTALRSSWMSAGVSTLPARSTSSAVW